MSSPGSVTQADAPYVAFFAAFFSAAAFGLGVYGGAFHCAHRRARARVAANEPALRAAEEARRTEEEARRVGRFAADLEAYLGGALGGAFGGRGGGEGRPAAGQPCAASVWSGSDADASTVSSTTEEALPAGAADPQTAPLPPPPGPTAFL